jgi:Flp pilus assembly pilin Flp
MFAYSFALVERAKAELALLKADNKGVTALEYGIIAAVTVAATGVGAAAIKTPLTTLWTAVTTALTTAAG